MFPIYSEKRSLGGSSGIIMGKDRDSVLSTSEHRNLILQDYIGEAPDVCYGCWKLLFRGGQTSVPMVCWKKP